MRTPLRRVGAVLVAAALLAACGSSTAKSNPPPVRSKPGGATVPGVKLIGTAGHQAPPSPATLRAAARGEEQFAVALYRALATGNGAVAIAPSSIATVLGMIETGARGATAQQLRDVLHVQLPEAGLAAAVGGLAQSFAGRSRAGVTLREVDQAWLQNGRSVLAPYADTLAGSYGAPLAAIDFTDPAAAATTVNAWFGARTHGKISQLLTADDLQNAVLVLTDAVYLDAQWAHGFDPKLTAPAPFDTASGGAVNVPTMHLPEATTLGYASGTGWQAVALPYRGNALEMDVIVPDDLPAFESTLDGDRLAAVISALRPTNAIVSMPRFDATVQASLAAPLERLGIRDAFDPTTADLSGIDGEHDLYVSDVIHEVVVHVDEQGTVAAAATAGVIKASAVERQTVVQVDKPFVYVVRDRTTGAILFLGRITDPR